MHDFGRRTLARTAGFLAIGALAYAASVMATTENAQAQIGNGDYWLYQPQQAGPVGRAWCNPDHTVEYWAYVDGEYEYSSMANGPGNRWHLNVERVSMIDYPTFNSFKLAVRALPEMAGKQITFQSHIVIVEIIAN